MRRVRLALLVVAMATGASFVCATSSNSEEFSEAWETVLDLRVIEGVLMLHLERTPEFEFPDEWTSMRSFAKTLPEPFQERLVIKDGWGRDFLVGSVRGQLLVFSTGPNGVSEIVEQFSAMTEDEDLPPSFNVAEDDDIVLLVGDRVVNGPRTTTEVLKVSMADLRAIGTAIETYSIDQNTYPAQPDGLLSVEFISPVLSPIYIRDLPVKDSWGNDILYWSDQSSYIVISMGADRALDRPYDIEPGWPDFDAFVGGYNDPDMDMVFANGQFVQWPERRSDR
jgi:hypothetical protein